MSGSAAVTGRITVIQAQLAALQRPPPVRASPTAAAATTAAPPSAPGQPTTFASALAAAGAPGVPGANGVPTPSGTTTAARVGAAAAPGSAAAGAPGRAVPSGRLTPAGAPVELAAYGNGRIPRDQLQEIGVGSHRLWAPAAEQFRALRSAATAAGVKIGVTDSYRTFESQVDLARRKGLYSQGGLAAKPGTSDHGWGRAVDLKLDAPAQAWMRQNAGRFGFVEDTPREPWHWAYTPKA